MDEPNQGLKPAEVIPEHILALSWNIATDPRLYRELAPNPYSPSALKTISERFPNASTNEVIRAVILAEPEGKFDRNFALLGTAQQAEELQKQRENSAAIKKRLEKYCQEYAKDFNILPKELAYHSLSLFVFETTNLERIEQMYSQNQRRDFRSSIIDFIEGVQKASDIPSTLGRPLKKIAFATLSLILLSLSFFGLYVKQVEQRQIPTEGKKQVLAIESQKKSEGFPVRLRIPAINVDAVIQQVGVTSKGAMGVPSNTLDVGWFDLGPRPGEIGSAVIAGHFDGEKGEAGAFTNLNKLKEGDKLYVEDSNGATTSFVVRRSRIYNPGYADDVFSGSDSARLNLITCDGAWNGARKSFSKRLVVFADISN